MKKDYTEPDLQVIYFAGGSLSNITTSDGLDGFDLDVKYL